MLCPAGRPVEVARFWYAIPPPMSPPHISVIIPAYNEAARLADTLHRCIGFLRGRMTSWEIIVVDDGSSDGTVEIARRFADGDGGVRLIRTAHAGKGAAVRRGMLEARGLWRFFTDADLSVDITELQRFLEVPGDVIVGSREARGAERLGEPLSRHLIGRAFNMLVRLLAVPGIDDTQCGAKLFSEAAARTLFGRARLNGFAFDVELLYLARRSGLTIREVPVRWHYGKGSRVRVTTGLRAFLQILLIRWNDLQGRYDHELSDAPLTI